MPINTVIREKRKELGLTQEQVATYLGVTTPAVNKWENGATCPDISLLSPLARLLQVDVNTLLCFHENLTELEVAQFANEVSKAIQQSGFEAALQTIREKVKEYPTCGLLLHTAATLLDSGLILSGLTAEKKRRYEGELLSLYERAAASDDSRVNTASTYMLATRYMQRKEFEKAQELVDHLPTPTPLDKQMLEADLLAAQDKTAEAAGLLERKLLTDFTEIHGILTRLINLEWAEENVQAAEEIAEISRKAVELFDLWEYYSYIAPLQVALLQKDAAKSVALIRALLASIQIPWNMADSALYHHIPTPLKTAGMKDFTSTLLPPLLTEFETDPKYEFLQSNQEFQMLRQEYQEKCGSH